MTDTNPILTFDGDTYNISDLSDEVKETISALQIADQQVHLYRDTVNVFEVGRNTLSVQLQTQLLDFEPVSADAVSG